MASEILSETTNLESLTIKLCALVNQRLTQSSKNSDIFNKKELIKLI